MMKQRTLRMEYRPLPDRRMAYVVVATLLLLAGCSPTPIHSSNPATSAVANQIIARDFQALFPVGDAKCVVIIIPQDGSLMTSADLLRTLTLDSIARLAPSQRFNLILTKQEDGSSLASQLLPATLENRQKAADFLDKWTGSSWDLIPSLRLAFAMKPDAIFLLASGDEPNNAAFLAEARRLNAAQPPDRKIQIHTVAWLEHGDEYEALLKQVARENGGTFKFADSAWVNQLDADIERRESSNVLSKGMLLPEMLLRAQSVGITLRRQELAMVAASGRPWRLFMVENSVVDDALCFWFEDHGDGKFLLEGIYLYKNWQTDSRLAKGQRKSRHEPVERISVGQLKDWMRSGKLR